MSYYGLKFADDLRHNAVHEFKDWRTAPFLSVAKVGGYGHGGRGQVQLEQLPRGARGTPKANVRYFVKFGARRSPRCIRCAGILARCQA